jgi:hypothetical protein
MSEPNTPTVEQLRAIGLKMGSWYERWYIGWTTDPHKVLAAEELGATARPYTSQDPKFDGWEIVLRREPNEGSNA